MYNNIIAINTVSTELHRIPLTPNFNLDKLFNSTEKYICTGMGGTIDITKLIKAIRIGYLIEFNDNSKACCLALIINGTLCDYTNIISTHTQSTGLLQYIHTQMLQYVKPEYKANIEQLLVSLSSDNLKLVAAMTEAWAVVFNEEATLL